MNQIGLHPFHAQYDAIQSEYGADSIICVCFDAAIKFVVLSNLKVKKELQYPYADYDWRLALAERLPFAKYDEKKASVPQGSFSGR